VHGLPALLEKAGVKRSLAVSNMIVSNPFGLPEKRYLMGAAVDMVLPVSVVAAGQMLTITAVTLEDRLQIGFLAIPEAAPQIDKLARYTVEAFDALQAAMTAPAATAPAHKPKLRKTTRARGDQRPWRKMASTTTG
jgi:hypothetical protein